LGALLHDIGKSMISPYIVHKPGRLTKEEFSVMQTHAVAGQSLLEKGNGKTQQNVFYPITQHHERLSGNGYPFKLKGEQIHLFGRITSIANFYDNLTTARPYKKAYTPYEALELMSENKRDFDQNLLVAFIKMIGLQALN
jgi:HD-GYP domain-containing protein (c-di-GMP phosphodiesterase class II)